jgi:hypothetical protein
MHFVLQRHVVQSVNAFLGLFNLKLCLNVGQFKVNANMTLNIKVSNTKVETAF